MTAPMDANRAVRRWATDRPDDPAFVGPTLTMTWAELDASADRCAAYLAALGVGPHDRVGWLGRNDVAYPVVLLATRRRRAALAGLNWRLAPVELRENLAAVAVDVVVVDGPSRELWQQSAEDDSAIVVDIGSGAMPWDHLPADPRCDLTDADIGPSPVGGSEVGLFWFTSGSTGAPKAVALSADRHVAQCALPVGLDHDERSRMLIVPPVFHTAGSIWVHLVCLHGGVGVFVAAAGPADLVDVLVSQRITHALMVPTLLAALVDEMGDDDVDLALECIAYGTAPMPQRLLRDCLRRFRCRFTQVYGLTECGGVASVLPDADHDVDGPCVHRIESVGRGVTEGGVSMRVRRRGTADDPDANDADADDADADEIGELQVRTPSLMLGYWSAGVPTSPELPVERWWSTGDLARMDADGYVYVTGRADDMIISGGENVHPAEVEAVLDLLDGVREAAVFGIPDEHWGQRVGAAVVASRDLTPDEVIRWCRSAIAHYKCPTVVHVVDELPRSATGKVLRGRLLALVAGAPTDTAGVS